LPAITQTTIPSAAALSWTALKPTTVLGGPQLCSCSSAVTTSPAGIVTWPFVTHTTPPGTVLTVSVAALVVVDPNAFVNVASYFVPLCAVVVGGVVYVADVAPLTGENDVAPAASADHCTVGAAQPAGVEAAATNVAVAGAPTV